MWKMRCPALRLQNAPYGHKNSRAYWQTFCKEQCLRAGFKAISDNWPCAYSSEAVQLLIVYVDDMKLAGPKHLMEETWRRLGENMVLEEPRGAQRKL